MTRHRRRARPAGAAIALALLPAVQGTSEAEEPPRYVLEWGGLGANPGRLDQLQDLALAPDGSVFVLEGAPNKRVQHFDANGVFLDTWRSSWWEPQAVAVGPDGSVYVLDHDFNLAHVEGRIVQKFSPEGSPIAVWGGFGEESEQFRARRNDGSDVGPRNIGVSPAGDVYVTDPNSNRILSFDRNGGFRFAWGGSGTGPGQFDMPGGVIASSAGDVYVSDRRNGRIQVFGNDGSFLFAWGSAGSAPGQFKSPYGMALDGDGNLYVADTSNFRVQKFSSSGATLLEWGRMGVGAGEFNGVFKVVVNAAGNLFVLDRWNNRIQRFDVAPSPVTPLSWSAVKQLFRPSGESSLGARR